MKREPSGRPRLRSTNLLTTKVHFKGSGTLLVSRILTRREPTIHLINDIGKIKIKKCCPLLVFQSNKIHIQLVCHLTELG